MPEGFVSHSEWDSQPISAFQHQPVLAPGSGRWLESRWSGVPWLEQFPCARGEILGPVWGWGVVL